MTGDEFDAWAPRSRRGFARRQVTAGLAAPAEAAAVARRIFDEELPHGPDTPSQHLWCARTVDGCVGHLWLRVRPVAGPRPGGSPTAPPPVPPHVVEAYVLDVEIRPEARRRGLGRAALLAGHRAAVHLGATVARLTVLGDRPAALGLYESLGYRVERVLQREGRTDAVAARLMSLSLPDEPPRGRAAP